MRPPQTRRFVENHSEGTLDLDEDSQPCPLPPTASQGLMTYTIFHPTFHPTPGTHFTALVQFSRRRKTSTEGVGSLLGHGRAGDTMTPRPSKHDPRGYTASGTALQEERWHRPFDRARLNLRNTGENTNPGLTWVSYPVSTGCVGWRYLTTHSYIQNTIIFTS